MVEAENSNMLSEGLILGVENLMKNIGDMKAEYEKMTNQILIARNLAEGTDNVDNLRFICNDLSRWLEHIVDKDSTLFNSIYELLKSLREIFVLYENISLIEKKREE